MKVSILITFAFAFAILFLAAITESHKIPFNQAERSIISKLHSECATIASTCSLVFYGCDGESGYHSYQECMVRMIVKINDSSKNPSNPNPTPNLAFTSTSLVCPGDPGHHVLKCHFDNAYLSTMDKKYCSRVTYGSDFC